MCDIAKYMIDMEFHAIRSNNLLFSDFNLNILLLNRMCLS